MQSRSLNQVGLASLVGINQKTVSNILRGSNSPSLEILEKIAVAFGISVAVLLSPGLRENLPPARSSPSASTARDIARLVEDFLLSSSQAQQELLITAREKAKESATHNK